MLAFGGCYRLSDVVAMTSACRVEMTSAYLMWSLCLLLVIDRYDLRLCLAE